MRLFLSWMCFHVFMKRSLCGKQRHKTGYEPVHCSMLKSLLWPKCPGGCERRETPSELRWSSWKGASAVCLLRLRDDEIKSDPHIIHIPPVFPCIGLQFPITHLTTPDVPPLIARLSIQVKALRLQPTNSPKWIVSPVIYLSPQTHSLPRISRYQPDFFHPFVLLWDPHQTVSRHPSNTTQTPIQPWW